MAAPLLVDPVPIDEGTLSPEQPLRRTRTRPDPLKLSEDERIRVVNRVKRFASEDEEARHLDIELREQRYAKLMQWTEEREGPWENCTNVTLPDILTACLRTEDTLTNAVLTSRPMVNARALDNANSEKERKIDQLHDTQFFVEQDGEGLLEAMVSNFVRDGTARTYTRWVTEHREIVQVADFDPIPLTQIPVRYFRRLLDYRFRVEPDKIRQLDEEGWDWSVKSLDGDDLEVRFYTRESDERVEMEIRGEVTVFDGPCVLVVPYEGLLHPYWCQNLQAPSASNPNGATHVILVDRPTIDEVGRLIDEGVYDLITRADLERTVPTVPFDQPEDRLSRQKDEMRGFASGRVEPQTEARNHAQTKRYICFDVWSQDGLGKTMDVVWTVLPELDLLARARPLSEMVPGNPPRRPFSESVFVPVQDRCIGMGLPEIMEGLHDFKTEVFNVMGDAAAIEIQPFFTYRPGGSINPEKYEIFPGAGLPQQNPGDVTFGRVQPTATAIAINEITLADQMAEKLTAIGDLQFGRIPTGKSSALRTAGGVTQLLAQGEARPERILRRLFRMLRDLHSLMYQLNRTFLDDKKRFRVIGVESPEKDPFVSVDKYQDLSGQCTFDFTANVLNTSKAALQQSLGEIVTLVLNPLMLQLGVADADGLYRLLCDYLRALGQSPEKYLHAPSPEARMPRLLASEAMSSILRGEFPVGIPAEESAEEHQAGMQELLAREDAEGITLQQTLEPYHLQLLTGYMQALGQRVQIEKEMEQRQQLMEQMRQQRQSEQQDNPMANARPMGGTGFVQRNEPMDEGMLAGTGTPA
jgi:hypothetical protein